MLPGVRPSMRLAVQPTASTARGPPGPRSWRMDRPLARGANGQIVEGLARLGVMLPRLGEVRAVGLLIEQRRQGRQCRADIAHDADIDGHAAADILTPQIDLSDANLGAVRVELAVGEIGAEHQQDVAIAHGVVAGREADEPGHADIVGVVPFHMLLAAQRMHHGRLKTFAQGKQLVVGPRAARAAQDRDALAPVEQGSEAREIV